jgi:hypothetical protein
VRTQLERGFEAQRRALLRKAARVREHDRDAAAQRLCSFAAIVRRKPRVWIERVTAIVGAVFGAREIDVVPALLHAQDAARLACKGEDVITLRAFAREAAVHAVV